MAPAIVLAPVNGALVNSLPKPIVLNGAALLTALGVFALGLSGWWLACWSVVAVGAALSAPTRSALLPAAAEDARISLPRVNSVFEAGAGAAVVAGLMLTLLES